MSTSFSPELKTSILKAIDTCIANNPGPHYAAFDADGTLWDSDVGETFFQYQIDHCNLSTLNDINPWERYKNLKTKHPPNAYLWLAQINNNQKFSDVQTWALAAAQNEPPKIFNTQFELIKELQNRGITIFVVSASVEWAVSGALNFIGQNTLRAIGVKTAIKSGLVTTEQDGPVTWQQGKAEALLEETKGIKPIFCSGNTNGDIHLLELSQTTPLCIQTQNQPGRLFDEESKLYKLAKQKAWYTHAFC